MNEHPLETLYNSLKRDNYDVPDTYESFARTLINDTNARRTLYNSLMRDNYDVPDNYDSFNNTLFGQYTTREANIAAGVDEESVKARTAQQPTQRNTGTPGVVPNRFGLPTQQQPTTPMQGATPPTPQPQQSRRQYDYRPMQGSGSVQTPAAEQPAYKPQAVPKPQQPTYQQAQQQQPIYNTQAETPSTPEFRNTQKMYSDAADKAWLKAEQDTKALREANTKKIEDIYNDNHSTMLGKMAMAQTRATALPIEGMAASLKAHDMEKMANDAWGYVSDEDKEYLLDGFMREIMREAARSGGSGGTMSQEEAEKALREEAERRAKARQYQAMYDKAVAANAPKDVLDFLQRKIVEGNSLSKLAIAAARTIAGTRGDMDARAVATHDYGKGHRVADITGSVLQIATDPVTWAAGGVGKGAVKGATNIAERAAGAAATRRLAATKGGQLAQRMIGGSANFAAFEGLGNIVEQLQQGGVYNEETGQYEYSLKDVAKAAGHGVLLGGATGVVGGLVGNVGDKVFDRVASTAGKLAVRGGQTLTSIAAEGTIFAAPELISGEGDFDTWLESVELMAGFKLQHGLKALPGTMGRLMRVPESRAGFETRLRDLLQGRPDLALTNDEREELERGGYTDLSELAEAYKGIEGKLVRMGDEMPYDRFSQLMADNSISEAARAKMYYYVTGRGMVQSTVTAAEIAEHRDHEGDITDYVVKSYNKDGGVITSRTYKNKKAAEVEFGRLTRQSELNSIDMLEKLYDRLPGTDATTAKMLRDVIGRESGIDIDKVIGKEENRRSDEEKAALQEYLNTMAKECQDAWDRQHVDVNQQRLQPDWQEAYDMGYNADAQQRSDISIEREDNPNDPQAQAAWQGVEDRIRQDAADRADQRRAEGERMAYKGKGDMQGAIRPLTINEDSSERDPETGERMKKTVYLVNGNIAIEPNGNGLSREGTDKTIYVYDPETGDTHELDPFGGAGVLSVGDVVSMEDYLADNEQQNQAEVQQEIDNATGKVNVQPNTPFVTPEGRQGIVKSVEGDNVIVQFADGEMEEASIPLADMQQYADELRRQEYEARHPQTPTEQPQQPNTGEVGQAPTAEQTAPQEGEQAAEDTRTPAQRTYDDMTAKYGEKASHKVDVTLKDRKATLDTKKKALDKAQADYDDAPIGKEDKAEAALAKAQEEYDTALADYNAWDEVRKLRDQTLLAQSEQEEQQRKAERERRLAEETEAQRKQREEYEADQARRKAEAEAAERRRQEENERLRQQEAEAAANPQPAEQPAPIEGTKGQSSQLEIARQELADDPEALAMLEDMEPRNLEEVAAKLLSSGKNQVRLQREDFLAHTGYSAEEAKRYPFIFASKEKGGVTISRLGELIESEAANYGIMYDENDAMAGVNAALSMLGSVYSQGDINGYIANSRIQQAYDYHNTALGAARARMLEAYGMTEGEYESYMSWLEDAIEQGKSTLSDEEFNQLFNVYEQGQTTDVARGNQEGAATTERTESAETDVSQNGERGNGETDAGTAAVSTEQTPATEGYTITPMQYTTKRGNVLDVQLVKFGSELSKEQYDTAKALAKELKGWWSREHGGFLMRSEDDARRIVGAVFGEGATAQAIAAAEAETDTNPTEGQKEAGNYKKGHVRIDGYDITIEQPKGSVRRGTDKNGRAWEQEMHNTYGYIRGTESVDGDHIDVFLSDDPTQGNVYVVDQVNEDGTFDEHKVMYGFPDMESARQAYLSNYEDGWRGLGTITPVSKEEFKKWIESSHRKTKPFSEYKGVKTEGDVMVGEGIKPAAGQTEGTAEQYISGYKPSKKVAEFEKESNRLAKQLSKLEEQRDRLSEQREAKRKEIKGLRGKKREEANAEITSLGESIARLNEEIDRAEDESNSANYVYYDARDAELYAHLGKLSKEKLEALAKQLEERLGEGTDALFDNDEYSAIINVLDEKSFEEQVEQPKQEPKAEKEEATEQPRAAVGEGKSNEPKRLISDEQMDELKERLRKKLRGQLNSGIDPETLSIGLQLAVGHIERGLTKFADFAKRMIEDLGDAIRPYLKSFYNGARDFPGAEKLAEQMTPYEEVRAFDVENFDKARPSSIVETAKEIAAEQEIEKQVEQIKPVVISLVASSLPEDRDLIDRPEKKPTKGNKKEDSTLSDTEQGQLDLFGTQTTNNNDNGLERPNAVRTEGGTRGQQTDSTESSVRTNSERTPQESGGTDGSGESGSVGALGQELQHGLRPNDELAEKRNTRNNHAERGKDYAPKDVDARIEANIAAIERMQQLRDAEKQATPADMAVLRKFSGWGGLGKAFDNYEYSTKLKALLGEEAYEQANLSRYSAFYTPAKITDTLWDIARALGFKGGRVLEGSAGIGNILGAMPTDMSEQSSIEAVEIDPTTGGILSLLYPDAKVNIKGFEETRVPNGSVDLAITNVPFVADMKVPKDETGDADLSSKFKRSIQDFCIAKNVRKLKEGGIGIFITSSGTLDNSEKLRSWLTNEGNADVVGAYRMNKNTFGGASVTTDIIVIRKRVNKQKSAHAIDVSGTTAVRTAKYTHSEWDDKKKDIVEKTDELTMDYNTYFVEHPEMMGGEMKFAFEKGDTYRPTSRALYPKNGVNQDNGLKEFVQSLSGKEWDKASDETTSDTVEYKELGEGITEGSMFVGEDGAFYVAQQGLAVPLEINNNKVKGHTKQECFEAYTAIKDAVSEVLDYETKNAGDEGLQPLLDKLNKAYDDFVSTYGHFQKNTSISFLKNDMGFSNVRALETMTEYNDEQGNRQQSFKKGDIFSKRVVEKEAEPKPTNAKDGVIASMYKYGRIDIPYISKQIGKSEEEVKNEILESGIGFENPQSREVEVTYEYLSGNVREKLRQAQEANENGEYDRNIKALQDIIPMNIPSHLIEFSIGSSWLDPKLYSDYISDRTGINVEMTYFNGMWMPSKVNEWNADTEKNREMSISSDIVDKTVWGHEMIIAAMQNRTIEMKKVVRDRVTKSTETIADPEATRAIAAKIDEIRADFKDWARAKMQSDPAIAEQVEQVYNERFNNFVPKSIPNDFVPEYFGGATHTIKLQPHQAKAAIRATTQPLMIAHEVGAGKTYTLITAAMEMRRIGTARKPMIVVQNATVGQFVESAKTLYPNAKILTLEDAEHNKGGRLAFYSMIKYNDWDMIIIPQSTFDMIPDSEDRRIAYIKEKIDEREAALDKLREVEDSESVIKQAENEIADMEAELEEIKLQKADKQKKRDQKREAMVKKNAATRAKEALDRYVDDVEDFEQMGIDAILVDEAHNYKRLGFATAMRRGVKGIDPAYSKRAQGVFLKAQSVMERTGGKNVVFATGTPISNTAAEVWTFMRYLMPAETLREYDIFYFDDFVRNFGNLTQMLEFGTNGKFRENNRFAGYINMPELARMWSGVADTKLTDDIEKERLERGEESKIPDMEGGKATDIYLPQTKALRSIMKYIKQTLDEFDKMKPREKKKNSHIPLTMYGVASRAAVDVRLVLNNGGEVVGHETGGQSVSSGADEPNSKTNEAVRQTLRSLEETKDYKGTVAIFADLYQNKETGFNLYEEIKRKLVAEGVPEEQVVIMKSGMDIKKKLSILDKVNSGEIRVIMGSTATLGTGVNIQERLHTLIHMDAPNRPMDYTQRNGRILRQGNIHKQMGKPVRVLRFGVEDSLDVTAYQRLKTKGAIADSVMRSGQLIANSMENRTMEEEEDLFGDTVAQLSGSEYAMLKQQAEREVRKYEAKRKQYESDQTYIHNQKPRLQGQIESAKQRTAEAQAALSKIEKAGGEKKIVIGKNTFANVAAMADFFKEYNKKVNEDSERVRRSYMQEKAWRDLPMNIGGFDFNVHLEIEKSYENKGGSMSSVAKRTMTYSCEALGLKDVPVRQALLRNAVEDIVNDVLTGNDFRERIEAAERGIARNEEALEQISKREGKPFEFAAELEEAKKRYEEYEQLMKAEMEAKEEKYAEMDAETTAIDASALSNMDEEDETTDSDVRFRGEEEPVFYSNAMRAVENIKQERATPEQWVKMIEKQGGLKAGEDKWLGLSEWLKGSDAKTLTKGEVLDYIRANEIQVEEVSYSEDGRHWDYDRIFEDRNPRVYLKGYNAYTEELPNNEYNAYVNGELIGTFYDALSAKEAITERLNLTPINETRLSYTTRGLDNKREIVLTVPTIEPWNEHDEVHFGEAGGGRAVAWVRFGETTDADGKRVLVIDEIQSKRHQEGREKGYFEPEARKAYKEYKEYLKKKYPNGYVLKPIDEVTLRNNRHIWSGKEEVLTEEEKAKLNELEAKAGYANDAVPDAPFEKNWHEVAMKRMLRFAAENGYDKVAWTKGEQQAERYGIGGVLDYIRRGDKKDANTIPIEIKATNHQKPIYFDVDLNGNVTYSMWEEFSGKNLSDIVGKEIANKLLNAPDETILEGNGLRYGGEGMKGFYDQILPRFMDKYGKKWGVKTGEVELPNIGEGGLTMWSVDVTDDMRESVMRGQPLFRNLEESDNVVNNADAGTRPLTDREKIAKLESEPKVKVYRSMQLIDGKLYPPMSARVDGQLREPSEIGVWEEAEEHPELADENGKFKLDKGNKKSLKAAYNPYIHTSRTMLNDQFSEAQSRPNLVVVEVEIPESELNGTYKAEKAKDSVGAKQWKAGVIQGQLSGTREVILSRWAKPVRIVPDAEVAENIARQIDGQVSVMPSNVVTPQVRAELEKRGVRFVETDNTGRLTSGSRKGETWAQVYGKNATKQREGGEEAYAGEWYDRNSVERIGEFAGYTPKQIAKMNARQEESARKQFNETAEKLHLSDNITFADTIDDVPGLTDEQRRKWRRKKGWYSPRTGKIVIILGNHKSMDDVMKSILHEGVAHHGLRQMFGVHFDTFLDNVYLLASSEIRERINEMAKKHGWDFREATEEYLAMLAEDTDFERPENQSWWKQVKEWFIDLLHKIGFKLHDAYDTITDNELRYILWRSYENLVHPGRYNSVVEEAKDIAKQYELKVGQWDETWTIAAEDAAEYAQRDAEYIEAVNSGDMEKAQRMVNEAAKRAMPDTKVVDENGNPLVVYHGTFDRNAEGRFYEFKTPSYFSNDEETAQIFSRDLTNEYLGKLGEKYKVERPEGAKGYVMPVFLDVKKPKIIDFGGKAWGASNYEKTQEFEKAVSALNETDEYDAVIAVNIVEGGNAKNGNITTTYAVKSPSQIKSADPVTYDDNGNVIPLSQRFNEGSDDIRFRDGEDEETGAPKPQARGAYERMVSSAASQWKEAMQDSMLSLKKLYQAVSQAYKGSTKGVYRIEDEKGYENAYLAENRMHSMSEAQIHAYQQDYMKPLQRAIHALTGGKREAYETLTDYMMAKHGLERNEVMAKREAKKAWEEQNKSEIGNPNYTAAKNAAFANIDAGVDDLYLEYRKQDYAGLTALTGIEDVEEAEKEAQRMVDEYEQQHDTTDLWIATNKATRRSLFKMLESGLLSPQRHAEIRDMYQYYIPLQGFDSDVAEDVYAYMGSDGTRLYGTTIRAAKGRKSKADDPIATIAMNGEAAIRRGNRNLMKQHFLRFVQSHPSDLVSINDVWLRKNANGEWEQYFDADLKETDTPEEVARKVRDFNERMEQEVAANPDLYKRSRELPNVPFRVLNVRDMEQHQVMVQVDGKNYMLTINGNPRAAQALNGLTNPDVFTQGAFGTILNATESVVRTLSQFYTTRNPNFVLSNFLRDAVYTNSMVLAKESPNYALNFHKNFLLLPNERMGVLFASWENGKLREKLANGTASNMEKMFYDFMMNGGETGWTSLRDIEKHKRDLQKALKREGNIAASALNKLGDFFDITNRMIENHARFTAYVTSIEMGRSVERAVWDAKEISVNFNKKGAGDKFLKAKNQTFVGKVGAFVSGLGRRNYAFWNASLQGLNNIARIGKRNPAKFMAVATPLLGLGVAIPLLNALLGGDDDDDKNAYWNLPEYVRRSNICFRFTKDMPWITIPLPIEFRAIYGLGELGSGVALGKEHYSDSELTKQVAAQFSQVLPLDFMEGGGGWHCLYPTYIKPVIEAYSNQSWTGLPIYRKNTYGQYDVAPEWQRAYSNTNNQIMAATKWLNEATGGDEVQGGNIDFNPARIEYMLRGYLGGYFTVADQVIKMGETATGNREFEWRNMMLANRVVKEGDERTEARKLTNEYFNLKDEYDKTDKSLKAYKKKQDEGTLSVVGQAHYIALMNDSEEYGRYLVFGTYKPLFDAYYKQIKEANAAGDSEEAKRLERGQNELRREMVNIIHDMDNGGTFDRKKVATGINENLKKMQNNKLWDAQDKAINKSIEADNALNPTDNVEE